MKDCVFENQSFSFWRIQIAKILDPPEFHLLLRIPPTHFVPTLRPGPFIYLYPSSDPPPHAAMTFLVVPFFCFLSATSPRLQPLASHPLMRVTYSSAHRYLILCLTQSPCLSAPCAVSHLASLASIANSNSVPTISISVPTAATSIVVLALTLTTPMVIG